MWACLGVGQSGAGGAAHCCPEGGWQVYYWRQIALPQGMQHRLLHVACLGGGCVCFQSCATSAVLAAEVEGPDGSAGGGGMQ